MTVNNGVTIDMEDVIEHLKLTDNQNNEYGIAQEADVWKISRAGDFFNPVTVVDNNVITFGTYSGGGPEMTSYSWE